MPHIVKAIRHYNDYDGKPVWRGYFKTPDGWKVASGRYGAIAYTSAEYARRGALVCAMQYQWSKK